MKISFFFGLLSCLMLSPLAQAVNVPAAIATTQSEKPATSPINLNTADAKQLSKSVKGIGVKRAEAIIKYREAHGPFKSISELSQVPGFGKNFITTHFDELQKIFTI